MNKKLGYSALGLAISIGGLYAGIYYKDDNVKAFEEIKEPSFNEVTPEQIEQAAKEVGEIKHEQDLMYKMIDMAIQKLQFEETEDFKIAGTIYRTRPQMTIENIAYLKDSLSKMEVTANYINILERWEIGNFNRIVEDYKEVREYINPNQDADAIEVQKRTAERELEYIKHFYGEEGLKKHSDQWK